MKTLLYLITYLIFVNGYDYYDILGSQPNHATSSRDKYKLIIVGAGLSGIGAGAHLLKNNFTDFIVLEASERIGGRLYTAPFGDFIIDYGCQWVHGQGDNIVYELASPHNEVYVQNGEEGINLVKGRGSKVNISEVEELFLDTYKRLEEDDRKIKCKCTLDSFIDKEIDEITNSKNISKESKEALVDNIKKIVQTQDGTDDLKKVGSWGNAQFLSSGGSIHVVWKNGYKTFIEIILGKYETKKLPLSDFVRFNKVVVSIDYTGDSVDVLCEDGTHYYADHVLSTVSLGVLKHSAKTMFKPVLPEKKQSAIDILGFDLLDKILIQFDRRWWPLKSDVIFQFLWDDEDKINYKNKSKHADWLTEIGYFHSVENQPRILEGWVTGINARKIEELPEHELIDGLMELFDHFMGDIYNITNPINITRSTWYNNRFVRGAYSFRTYESDKLGLFGSDIAEPILNNSKPVLLFAGEATNNIHFATAHGAYETGLREANRILNFIK